MVSVDGVKRGKDGAIVSVAKLALEIRSWFVKKAGYLLGNMCAVELAEDSDFLLNVVNFIFGVLEIDDFDSNWLSGSFVEALVDFTEGTLSNSILLDVVVFGISTLRWLDHDGQEVVFERLASAVL